MTKPASSSADLPSDARSGASSDRVKNNPAPGDRRPAPDADQADRKADSSRPEVVFLGTGTSVGVPAIGCDCPVCRSSDPKNKRTRCAIVFRLPDGDLLVDTPPDLRAQLLREDIGLIHAIMFTHEHADHLFGLDDVRLFPFRLHAPVPIYCQEQVDDRIRKSFDYAFSDREETHPGSKPRLELRRITHDPFEALGVPVTPIPMLHGPHFEVLGFRIGDFAYCTDTNGIPDASMELLRGLDTLVIGALRYKPHPTHFTVDQAIEVSRQLSPKRTLLTHIGHDLDHGPTNESLPPGIELAYDGLRVPLVGL
ncbi:Phosphoribosyl 1,2-cyclic phosphodiesterase [Crateriforma conspicua]|uniref:Phosphoribosyl 1,2-cyclic phosphodiesterase n=1 Tax=Crateriforma conspicua TaxID=2527996 RepID=A0A5C6FWG4_9PLAN|nr:MBL fold metallo-hydrolase [Crateriforma conspicua]TWU65353.1 Phosphoribosyl 1,2-cyclic phosphodiesterase [Crateriforma conspicua]